MTFPARVSIDNRHGAWTAGQPGGLHVTGKGRADWKDMTGTAEDGAWTDDGRW